MPNSSKNNCKQLQPYVKECKVNCCTVNCCKVNCCTVNCCKDKLIKISKNYFQLV